MEEETEQEEKKPVKHLKDMQKNKIARMQYLQAVERKWGKARPILGPAKVGMLRGEYMTTFKRHLKNLKENKESKEANAFVKAEYDMLKKGGVKKDVLKNIFGTDSVMKMEKM